MARKKRLKLGEEVMRNEDLLSEVLLRLPAKPLIRFKCVSKHWLSLISDPKFCSKQTMISPTSIPSGVYYNDKYSYDLKSVSLNQANQKNLPSLAFIKRNKPSSCGRPKIMHASNGLLLGSYHLTLPYFVCNVTTQTMTILPQHVITSSECYYVNNSAYMVFEPLKSHHFNVVLLGLTISKHDKEFHYDEEYTERAAHCFGICYKIDVYSSETRVWKRLFFRASHGFPLDFKAVCNGSLHWITKDKVHVQFEVYTSKIVSDPLPSNPKSMNMENIRYFGECCGNLFLIHIPWTSAETFHVFELEKDHSSWKMKYSVNMSLITAAYPDSFQYEEMPVLKWKFFVLCVVKEDEISGFSMVLGIPGKIVLYDLRKNTFKVLQEFPKKEFPSRNSFCYSDAFPFMSTLCPL